VGVLVFVAKPALADNFTYKQYSASSEDWKRGFVFAVAQHQTTINSGEGPPYSTTRAFQRCLSFPKIISGHNGGAARTRLG
jgi:hypothetical protein